MNATQITQEEIRKAKDINLISYCLENGIPLLNQDSRNPSLEEHDSLVFYPENKERQWHRFSTGEGGDAIDFVRFYENKSLKGNKQISFQAAIHKLLSKEYERVTIIPPKKEIFEYINEEVEQTKHVENYLIDERKIDRRLISYLITRGFITQNKWNSAVFKWIDYDQNNKIVGANEQGAGTIKKGRRSFKKYKEILHEEKALI